MPHPLRWPLLPGRASVAGLPDAFPAMLRGVSRHPPVASFPGDVAGCASVASRTHPLPAPLQNRAGSATRPVWHRPATSATDHCAGRGGVAGWLPVDVASGVVDGLARLARAREGCAARPARRPSSTAAGRRRALPAFPFARRPDSGGCALDLPSTGRSGSEPAHPAPGSRTRSYATRTQARYLARMKLGIKLEQKLDPPRRVSDFLA